MKNFNWKGMLPHIGAVLFFLVLTLVYFSPVLDGKDIMQDDAIGSMGWGKDAKDYHENSGEYSYWSNSMFSGMPCNFTYSPQAENTFEPIGNLMTLNTFGASRRHIGSIFLTFLGCYIMFLAFRCRPLLSIAGSIAYTLCSYNFIIIVAGHMNKGLVIATIAPIIGGIILCYRRKLLAGALVTLIFAGLNIFWSHQQMTYYTAIIAAIIAIVYFIYAYREKWLPYYWKATGVLVVVAALSILPAIGILLPTADYSKESIRGGSELKAVDGKSDGGLDTDYAFAWSYGVDETLTLFIPSSYGAASRYNLGKESHIYKFYFKSYKEYYSTQYINYLMVEQRLSLEEAKAEVENGQTSREIKKQAQKAAEISAKQAPAYWGRQPFTSGPVYMGAIVCFLFVLGLFIVKGPEKWWLVAATIFSLILAWGSDLAFINNFLFEYMPLYNKFRAPSQALVITTLTMSLLAILAIKKFSDTCSSNEATTESGRDKNGSLRKAIYYSMGITGGIALFCALFGSYIFPFTNNAELNAGIADSPEFYQALLADRKDIFTSDSWRSLLFVLLSGGLMLAYTYFKKIKNWMLLAAFSLLLLVDMWPVCQRFLNDSMFMPKKNTTHISKSDADRFIHETEDKNKGKNKYRVLDFTRGNIFNQAETSYFHNSIGGYSPAKLSRYQDLCDNYIEGEIGLIGKIRGNIARIEQESGLSREQIYNMLIDVRIVNMLNTKYFITGRNAEDVIVNHNAFGHCWFVDNIKWVDNAKEEMAALDSVTMETAIVDKKWKEKIDNPDQYSNNPAASADDYIELTEYRNPGNIIYRSSSAAPRLAVFSDIYYKTWKVYIDGKEVTPVRANYVLRAVPVPAGEHTIEFKCVDEVMITSHKWSLWMSILVWCVLIGLAGTIIYRKVKGKE